jgi:hypothetical protein
MCLLGWRVDFQGAGLSDFVHGVFPALRMVPDRQEVLPVCPLGKGVMESLEGLWVGTRLN